MAASMEEDFQSYNLEFCSACGSVLPLPEQKKDYVSCKNCDYKIPVEAFHGIKTRSHIKVNKRKKISKPKEEGEDPQNHEGPKVDRTCSECGNEGMTYHTKQTRSADEGQTVFYTCPKCNFQEFEYS